MKRLLRLVVGLVIVLTFAILLVSALGSRLFPIPAEAIALFGEAPIASSQACWREICPGKTTFSEAQTTLRKLPTLVKNIILYGHDEIDWTVTTSPPVAMLGSWYNSDVDQDSSMPPRDTPLLVLGIPAQNILRLGDALHLFGRPVFTSRFCSHDTGASGRFPPASISFDMYFANGIWVKATDTATIIHQQDHAYSPDISIIRPQMKIELLGIAQSPTLPMGSDFDGQPWRGFGKIEQSFNC